MAKFPCDPILMGLLEASRGSHDTRVIIHDVNGFEKSYPELLQDILSTRRLFCKKLPSLALDGRSVLREAYRNVAILSRSAYEFLVAFFAIRALGGVCVPLASGILAEEALYFLKKAKCICMLSGKDCLEKAGAIYEKILEDGCAEGFFSSTFTSDATVQSQVMIDIDETLQMDPNEPGLIVYTSGTTGRPKGVVLPRCCLTISGAPKSCGAIVNYRPFHWMGGMLALVSAVLNGKRVYHVGEDAGAESVLAAFKNHQITDATFNPALLRRMKEALLGQNGQLSEIDREKYSSYFKSLTRIRCSSATLDWSTRRFWIDLTGLPIQNAYGTTELGCGAMETEPSASTSTSEEVAIGFPMAGVKVKLSEGNHGEIRIKCPNMLLCYLDDEKSTKAAFDEDGYYKTGDLGELKDGQCFFSGRATSDFILFRTLRIPILRVENALMDLPYITEACVVALPHKEARELCGAVVKINKTPTAQPNLAKIQSDLQDHLPFFMMPLALRLMNSGEELSRNASGKFIKKRVLEEFFNVRDWFSTDDLLPGVEFNGSIVPKLIESGQKPWEWGGIQRASD